jgi:hypothetical protein
VAVKRQGVGYASLYLWQCPDCKILWQARHRPRRGAQLVCAPLSEQRAVGVPGFVTPDLRGCGSVNVSTGQREGIAPNVSL